MLLGDKIIPKNISGNFRQTQIKATSVLKCEQNGAKNLYTVRLDDSNSNPEEKYYTSSKLKIFKSIARIRKY